MTEQNPFYLSKSLIGDEDYRGIDMEAGGSFPVGDQSAISAGVRGGAGQGQGFVDGYAQPFARVESGPLHAEISQDYYAGRDKGFGSYYGKGSRNLMAGANVPVGRANLSLTVSQALDKFQKSTQARASLNIPF